MSETSLKGKRMPTNARTRTPFAERLVSIRKARGITQRELAKLAGITHRIVAGYETVIKNPTPDAVVRIAKALRVSTDELMGHKAVKISDEVNRRIVKKAKILAELPPRYQKEALDYIELLKLRKDRRARKPSK